ncbi:MAG: tetratricopeptide repeat protein [Myxococcota bacterium]
MRRTLLWLFFAAWAGCFYPADRGKALEAKVDKLAARNVELERDLAAKEEKLAQRVDEKIAQVEKALEGLDKASRRSDADTGVLLQKTIEDLAELKGQIESHQHKATELEKELLRLTEETDRKIAELKGTEAVKAAEAKKKADELRRPEGKQEFLALAAEKAKAGELLLARQLYGEFLKKWAKDELRGEAHFGLGETYFTEDKCREALFEYGKVIQEFGKTPSAPSAYLRSSECFKKLKMGDESRLALEEVVKQYPKSSAASAAKARIQELDKSKKPAPKGKK